jgi:hypothetical protein
MTIDRVREIIPVAEKALGDVAQRLKVVLEIAHERKEAPRRRQGKNADCERSRLTRGTSKSCLRSGEKHQRVRAGIPGGADVDLSLVRLLAKALMFRTPSSISQRPRNSRNFSKEFARRAGLLGFGARSKAADASLSTAIGALAAGFLGS